jgi:hypothetical protein
MMHELEKSDSAIAYVSRRGSRTAIAPATQVVPPFTLPARSEERLDRGHHIVVVIDQRNDLPLIEGRAGMGDAERHHVTDR